MGSERGAKKQKAKPPHSHDPRLVESNARSFFLFFCLVVVVQWWWRWLRACGGGGGRVSSPGYFRVFAG